MQRKELIEKYKKRIASELYGKEKVEFTESYSYSNAYKVFKQEHVGKFHGLFEKFCVSSEKILPIKITENDAEKIKPSIKLAHLDITPRSVYSLTYLSIVLTIILSVVFTVLFANLFIVIAGLIIAVILLFYIPRIPKQILMSWRAKTSDQLVLSILYMVIYMEHTPNLEHAVRFVAEHMSPPVSLDFMKILWDVETKVYPSITEALNDYSSTWREWDAAFVDSLQLIESSLYEPDEKRRHEIFDKAIEIILEGTQDSMLHFAHNLQSPVQSLHMLGIVLPVMSLVMLPMVGAFLGQAIKWYYLVILYNILLPVIVFAIAKSVLSTRPAGASGEDIYDFVHRRHTKPTIEIFGKKVTVNPILLGIVSFFAISWPAFLYYYSIIGLTGKALQDALFSNVNLFASLDVIAAVGISLGLYYWSSVAYAIKLKKIVEKTENEFSAAMFRLGQILQEHHPPEVAFAKAVQATGKSEVWKFFQTVDYNIRHLGASLQDAIFNENYGAILKYPSAMIRSAMAILVEGAKKSPEIAGRSLITISKYIRTAHRVIERLKDLLADTISSMSIQVKVFISVIAGIVVGMAALTIGILRSLGEQLAIIGAQDVGAQAVGAGLLDIFQIEYMMPTYIFQIIVGIYLIQIVFILSFMLSGIIYGYDKAEQRYLTGQNLIMATVIYVIITTLTVLLFTSLAAPVSQMVLT